MRRKRIVTVNPTKSIRALLLLAKGLVRYNGVIKLRRSNQSIEDINKYLNEYISNILIQIK